MSEQVIHLRAVSKRYGKQRVVEDVDLDVHAGECVVAVGHNGAGKTTLMKLVLGVTRATDGELTVLGGNPLRMAAAQRRLLGYLPENVSFQGAMKGHEVLSFYASLKGLDAAECTRLLEMVGLGDVAQRRIATYSKGMRQRLGLAQAILGNPRLLMLDEPTSGMDPVLRGEFYDVIDVLRSSGAGVFISSHALNEVEARADRFVIMKSGKFVASGTLKELTVQAALPVSMNIFVSAGRAGMVAQRFGTGVDIHKVNDHVLGLSCHGSDKMSVLRRVSELGSEVTDMEITPPRLDQIYRHFMRDAPTS